MRPQVLTVSAFGPYAGEITIDFELSGDAGTLSGYWRYGAEKQAFLSYHICIIWRSQRCSA